MLFYNESVREIIISHIHIDILFFFNLLNKIKFYFYF